MATAAPIVEPEEAFAVVAPVMSAGAPAPPVNPFAGRFMGLNEFLSQPDNDSWLLTNFVAPGDLGLVFGDSGTGKSFVIIDLLFSLATGLPWCNGLFEVPCARPTLYATGEGLRGVRRRFYARDCLLREHGDGESPHITILPLTPQLFDRKSEFRFENFIAAHVEANLPSPALVVIDTLATAAIGADENDAGEMQLVIDGAQKIRDAFGAVVLLVHHCSKQGDSRGSTALRAAVDFALKLKKGFEGNTLVADKFRDAEPFSDQGFRLYGYESSACVEWTGPVQASSSPANAIIDVLNRADSGLPSRLIAEMSGVAQQNVLTILRKMEGQGLVSATLEFPDRAPSNRNGRLFSLKAVGYPGEK